MLIAENITKKFSGVTALSGVNMELPAGKVTALIGENGAGKSTLMKILSGVYTQYEGRIVYKGQPVAFTGTADALQQGIAIIHQELNLVPHLTVWENIFLGRELTTRWGLLDKKQMRRKTEVLLRKLKLDVAADEPIANLKVGQQQVVEIAKALLTESEVIIMDEPTSAISEAEVDVLFDIIHHLRQEGKAIVYISHKLDELYRIADRYVVLRDGCTIEAGDMQGVDQDTLISKMVGREIKVIRRQQAGRQYLPLMEVANLSLAGTGTGRRQMLNNVSFALGKGEILGVFGLMGAGRTELLEAMFGLHARRLSGAITVGGRQVNFRSAADAIDAGLALVPEDRKKDGLVLGMEVRENICLTTLGNLQRKGLLSSAAQNQLANKYVADLKIKTSSLNQLARNLSGGNQQKIVLAKWLATHPQILMLDEPTRGIDIHAKTEIYKLILTLAEQGLGIIMVSSELPEILAVCDRVLVMAEGNLTASFTIEEATEDNILKAAIPKTM